MTSGVQLGSTVDTRSRVSLRSGSHLFDDFDAHAWSSVSLWRWSFHTSPVSDSHLFGAVSPEKYRNLNTPGDDFRSCFRIFGSTADARAHAFVYGF